VRRERRVVIPASLAKAELLSDCGRPQSYKAHILCLSERGRPAKAGTPMRLMQVEGALSPNKSIFFACLRGEAPSGFAGGGGAEPQ